MNFFISYSRKDIVTVRPVTALIRATGANAFRDEDSIPPGKLWRAVLSDSIRNADVIVLFWSKNAAASKAVRSEYREAAKLGKDILPVLLDDQPLPNLLAKYQYIDFRPMLSMTSSYDAMLRKLSEEILTNMGNEQERISLPKVDFKYEIFVIYPESIEDLAAKLAFDLERIGTRIYLYQQEINGRPFVNNEIYALMANSQFSLILFTEDSLNNPHATRELDEFVAQDKGVIAVFMDFDPQHIPWGFGFVRSFRYKGNDHLINLLKGN